MDLTPSTDGIFEAMAPYIEERFPIDSAEWKKIREAEKRKWRFRFLQRKLLGWMPDAPNLPTLIRGKRSQKYVRASYENTWATHDWPDAQSPPNMNKTSLVEGGREGFKVRNGGLARAHLLVFARMLQNIRPSSILEVGCGNGKNLFALSGLLPQTQWYGIDLTQAGIDKAHSVQEEKTLPKQLIDFAPLPIEDITSFQNIQFRQGDAKSLPYADSTFDLVFTHLALEQMEAIRESALIEMARVSRQYIIMVEPFAEFNHDSIQLNYVRAKDYFSLPYSELVQFGIMPTLTFHDFPQQITLGAGLVVGTVSKKS